MKMLLTLLLVVLSVPTIGLIDNSNDDGLKQGFGVRGFIYLSL